MESFYYVTPILTAGIALTLAIFSLLKLLHKGWEKVNLFFSILCLLIVIFILIPPTGFNFTNSETYSNSIILKRIFNLSILGLFPWFIASYTGYRSKLIPYSTTTSLLICCLIMLGTSNGLPELLSVLTGGILLPLIMAYCFYVGYRQFKNGQKTKAAWMLTATGFFALFDLPVILSQSNNDYGNIIFLAINACLIAFMLIMGIHLNTSPDKQFSLEKILRLREDRWQSLLDNIQLIVVNTDMKGRIRYINPYGVSLLGYEDAPALIDTSWSDHCLQCKEAGVSKTDFRHVITTGDTIRINKNAVITKDGKEKIISWNSDLVYNDDGDLVGIMNIGSDITRQEQAIHQIKELKAELEKEKLMPNEDSGPSGMHHEIIGKSRPFIYAIQKSKQVAPTNASVLLLGETGVGKECFADLIQETSLRSNKPFVKVNCGALPAELIEDELFGHEKGAFTGAIQSRMGRFEKANGGTIFLDEIGELPLVLQPKLLRVLQNGEFERVGGHHTVKVDVRVIAATNSDLEKEVKENRFREDLFYRLNVFPITIPPLRKRNEDIGLLIQHFIEMKSKEHTKHFENISKADMNRLCDYGWPGNIRELKNVIERAVISSENNTLKLDWFYKDIENNGQPAATTSLEEMETAYILKVLQECRWKINGENGAAEKLVMHPNTLRSRMKKLKINVPWKQD